MLRLTALAPLTLALAACGAADPTVSVTATPTTITSGDTVTLSVTVTDFELRNPGGHMHGMHELRAAEGENEHHDGAKNSADGGHYHVYLNTLETNPLRMAWTTSTTVAVTGPAGAHTLIVRLNKDDHSFLVPQVTSEATVTIR